MNKSAYHQYLASREWAVKKEAVKVRSQGFCELCHHRKLENTHHITYEHIGNEPLEDLIGVCEPCHLYLSGKSEWDPSVYPDVVIDLNPGNELDDLKSKLQSLREFMIRNLYPIGEAAANRALESFTELTHALADIYMCPDDWYTHIPVDKNAQ